jgi:ABC-type transport system involved in multi-copper enzyme maturation permease subunit
MIGRICNLIGVELTKLTRQRIFYTALILIIATVVLSVLLEAPEKKSGHDEELSSSAAAKSQPAKRPDGGFGPLSKACKNGFILASILMLIFSSLSVSSETTTGTIRMILTRPIRRSELFFAKAITLIMVAVFIVIIIEVISVSLSYAAYGLNNITYAEYPDTPFQEGARGLMLRYSFYSFALTIFPLVAIIFFGLLVSTLVENAGFAVALAILIYLAFDYILIGLVDDLSPYFFFYYDNFYWDKLNDLANTISNSTGEFSVLDELLGFGNGDIKTAMRYHEWLFTVLRSIIVPIAYVIIFSIPSLVILNKKDILS